jgi:transglutaminase-like putative cysteine protease
MPAPFKGQRLADWQVRVTGCPKPLEFRDGFGNTVLLVTVSTPHSEMTIEAAGTVETEDCNGVVAGLPKSVPPRVFLKETPQTRPDAAIRALAQSVPVTGAIERLHALAAAVRDRVEYVEGATDAHTGAAEALGDGANHAWAEAHVEALGWVGFDVANGICPSDRYVRLACGLDAGYAAPIVGSRRGGAGESLDVRVAVQQQSAQQ